MTWFTAAKPIHISVSKSSNQSEFLRKRALYLVPPPELEKFYQDHNLTYVKGREYENLTSITTAQLDDTFFALWKNSPLDALFFTEAMFQHAAYLLDCKNPSFDLPFDLIDHLKLIRKVAFEKAPWLTLIFVACLNNHSKKSEKLLARQPDAISEGILINNAITVLKEAEKKDPALLNSWGMERLTRLRITSHWNAKLNSRLEEIMTKSPKYLTEADINEAEVVVSGLNLLRFAETPLENPWVLLYPRLFIGYLADFILTMNYQQTSEMLRRLCSLFEKFNFIVGRPSMAEHGKHTELWRSVIEQFADCARKLEDTLLLDTLLSMRPEEIYPQQDRALFSKLVINIEVASERLKWDDLDNNSDNDSDVNSDCSDDSTVSTSTMRGTVNTAAILARNNLARSSSASADNNMKPKTSHVIQ